MSERRLAAVIAAVAIVFSLAAAKPKSKAKPPQIVPKIPPVSTRAVETKLADGRRVDLTIDGPLWGWAAPRQADGTRELYLLTGPPEAKKEGSSVACGVTEAAPAGAARTGKLFRWRPAAPESLELVASGLPEGSLETADAGGADEVLLVRAGAVDLVRTGPGDAPATKALIEDAEIGRRFGDPRQAIGVEGDGAIRQAVIGAFRSWTRRPDGTLRESSSLDLPVEVDPGPFTMRVQSPDVLPVGRSSDGRALYATAPEAVGFERLRTVLFDPDGPEPSRARECWAQLPGRERLLESGFVMLDRQPVLVALTISADKLSVFGEKRLRLFPLGEDRTRVGGAPELAVDTGVNLWQGVSPFVADLDADGKDDLVLGYWKGLKSSIAALEFRRRGPDGSFGKARTIELEVAEGDRGFIDFGRDLDGDHRPDLALLAGGALRVYPGSAPAEAASRPVDAKPSRVVPLASASPSAAGPDVELRLSSGSLSIGRGGSGAGNPRFVDFDGDGRPEVLFVGMDAEATRGSVVFVRGAPAS